MAFEFPMDGTAEVVSFLASHPTQPIFGVDTSSVGIGARAISFANGITNQRIVFPEGTKPPAIPEIVSQGVDEQIRYGLRLAGMEGKASNPAEFAKYKATLAKP